jgi:uncharacterized membrane protein YidH (DUF202 family)
MLKTQELSRGLLDDESAQSYDGGRRRGTEEEAEEIAEELAALAELIQMHEEGMRLQREKVVLLQRRRELRSAGGKGVKEAESSDRKYDSFSIGDAAPCSSNVRQHLLRTVPGTKQTFLSKLRRRAPFLKSHTGLLSSSQPETGRLRMNRMNADFANERTMLAWTRTSLAVVRTTFSALALKGITGFGTEATTVFVIGSSVMAAYSYAHGYFRYKTMKDVIELRHPPMLYERVSNNPTFAVMFALFVVVVIDTATRQWS